MHEKGLNITNHQGNANQNHNMNFLMPMRMASHKNIKDADEDVEKRELMYTVGRNLNLYSHCGK